MHYPFGWRFFLLLMEFGGVLDRSRLFLAEGFRSVEMTTAKLWAVVGGNHKVLLLFCLRRLGVCGWGWFLVVFLVWGGCLRWVVFLLFFCCFMALAFPCFVIGLLGRPCAGRHLLSLPPQRK
jgi:hypothetical protein